ncbi:MAG: hypothetical protein RLZZ124_1044 [Cyanobacteriota bacterium]
MAGRSDELAVQNAIRLEHGAGPARLWRNNTGALKDSTGRLVRYGLCPGSSDLIGLRTRIITETDLGHRFAQFVAIEVKDQGRLTEQQRAFLAMVTQAGGLAGVARSPEDARTILRL